MKNNKSNNLKSYWELSNEELVKLVSNDPFFKKKKKEAIELLEKIGLSDGSQFKAPPEIKKDLF